jgi:LPXTG-motif cell wall-anchored protein
VTLPGVSLPAGKYLFRIANPETNRKVVQVMSEDEKKAYAMFFTMPSDRGEASSEPEVSFIETAPGMPEAIRTWWYPGEKIGYEFVYPKEQARRIAKGSSEAVLTTKAETKTAEETETSELTRISPSGEEVAVDARGKPAGRSQRGQVVASSGSSPSGSSASATAPAPSANRSESSAPQRPAITSGGAGNQAGTSAPPVTARVNQSGAEAPRQTTQSARASLPQTATVMPTVAWGGMLALAGGLAMLLYRRSR